jgi:hypothetical protein
MKNIKSSLQNLFSTLKRHVDKHCVLAEEATPPATTPATPSVLAPVTAPAPVTPPSAEHQIDLGALLTQTREQAAKTERDKLYPELEKLRKENTAFRTKNNDYIIESGTKDARIKELEGEVAKLTKQLEGKPDDTETQKYKDKIKELEGKIAEFTSAQTKSDLDKHVQDKIKEANGELIEDMVSGTTLEEIDASVELAKAAYKKMVAKFGTALPSARGIPPVGTPAGVTVPKTLDINSLKNLDMRNPENRKLWDEARKQMGLH